eukprot:PDM82226.1 hypothetical protein PRIPAC_36619 [Pristionchus pacificus]
MVAVGSSLPPKRTHTSHRLVSKMSGLQIHQVCNHQNFNWKTIISVARVLEWMQDRVRRVECLAKIKDQTINRRFEDQVSTQKL